MIYTLNLRLQLPLNADMDNYDDRLYADDVTGSCFFGIDENGLLEIEDDIEDINANRALTKFQNNVMRVLPEARFIEAFPDIVNTTTLGQIFGVSRQAIGKMFSSNIDTFPAPLHSGSTNIWNLAHVLNWLKCKSDPKFDSNLHETACANLQMNLKNQQGRASALWRASETFEDNRVLQWTTTTVASVLPRAANYETVIDRQPPDKHEYLRLAN